MEKAIQFKEQLHIRQAIFKKMKKNIIILLTLVFIFVNLGDSFAQSKTATPTESLVQQQIDELKSKIASKVAELKLVEKRGIIGTVTDSSDTQISLIDLSGNIRKIDVDELTKFYSSSQTFGISDIKKGRVLGILGLYNKQSRRILAREVNDISSPQEIIYGAVSAIDKENFEITLTKENNNKAIIEIQDITRSLIFSSNTLSRSGFSKIAMFETAIVAGLPDKQNSNKILATRIILLPNIGLASKLNINLEPTIPPSTGSGVKLFPIKK